MKYAAVPSAVIRIEGDQQIISTVGAGKLAPISAHVVKAIKPGVPSAVIVAQTYTVGLHSARGAGKKRRSGNSR